MAQSILRYNVVIIGMFFNKGSWVSEAWRKEYPEEFSDEHDASAERIPSAEERRKRLHLDHVYENAVLCGLRARHLHAAFG